jgi:hypothetical protein
MQKMNRKNRLNLTIPTTTQIGTTVCAGNDDTLTNNDSMNANEGSLTPPFNVGTPPKAEQRIILQ